LTTFQSPSDDLREGLFRFWCSLVALPPPRFSTAVFWSPPPVSCSSRAPPNLQFAMRTFPHFPCDYITLFFSILVALFFFFPKSNHPHTPRSQPFSPLYGDFPFSAKKFCLLRVESPTKLGGSLLFFSLPTRRPPPQRSLADFIVSRFSLLRLADSWSFWIVGVWFPHVPLEPSFPPGLETGRLRSEPFCVVSLFSAGFSSPRLTDVVPFW